MSIDPVAGPAEILDDTDIYINEDVQKALDAEFAGRGMRRVAEAARADMQVAYFIKLREHQEYASVGSDGHEFSGGLTYSRKSGTWSYAEREPDLSAYAVETGKLTVLIYDAKTGKRVWRGTLQTEIDRSQGKDAELARIQEAAENLIAQLPEN